MKSLAIFELELGQGGAHLVYPRMVMMRTVVQYCAARLGRALDSILAQVWRIAGTVQLHGFPHLPGLELAAAPPSPGKGMLVA